MKTITAIFLLISCGTLLAQEETKSPLGYWYGQLELMGTTHELLLLVSPEFHAKNNKPLKNKYVVELLNQEDSSSFPFKVQPVNISAKQFEFGIKDLNLKYSGAPDSQFQRVEGTFEQSGFNAPLVFGRTRFAVKSIERPQTPMPPFSYHHREVVIPHIKENFQLAGTLTLPADTTKPFPVVIMASGSGAQDRDEEIMGHRPFWVIADYLAKNGIASLRFDDRGVGKSGGVFSQASLIGFSKDVESVLEFVKNQPTLSDQEIGVLGHSEGAMHAWILVNRRSDVDFIISLAGPAISGRKIIEQQQYDIALLKSESAAIWTRDLFRGVMDIISNAANSSTTQKDLDKFIKKHHKTASKEIQDANPLDLLLQRVPSMFNTSWGREFIAWSPENYLPNYQGRVLFIIGDRDLQVHPELNIQGFQKLTEKYEPLQAKAIRFENLNHLLQTCKKCSIEEYGELVETISPLVLDEIVTFLQSK